MSNNYYSQEEYKKALGRTNYDTKTNDETTNYYNALKNESYKAMLNSEVQAQIARDQASKYTAQALQNQGYNNQGLAESTNLGIQNQYRQALSEAGQQHQNNLMQLAEKERQEKEKEKQEKLNKANEDFQSFTTLMSGATSQDELNDIVNTYGYGKVNSNGNMEWNTDAISNYDDSSKKQMMALYNMYNSQLKPTNTMKTNANTYMSSLDALKNASYITKNGNTNTLGKNFYYEINNIMTRALNNEYSDGDIIKVTNGDKEILYFKYTPNGFQFTDENSFNNAKNKYTLTRKDKKNVYNKA